MYVVAKVSKVHDSQDNQPKYYVKPKYVARCYLEHQRVFNIIYIYESLHRRILEGWNTRLHRRGTGRVEHTSNLATYIYRVE